MTEGEVATLHKSSQSKINIPPYKMRYVKNRFFNLQKGYYRTAPYAYFYDARQYQNTPVAWCETVEECISKAKEARDIGEQVIQSLSEIGLHTERLISPVRVFEDSTLNKLNLSSEADIPEMAGYYAYESCTSNWLEAFQLGHWDKVWDYDISSAYPAEIAKLMDLRQGKWIQSNKFIPEAQYGRCIGKVTIQSEFSPIVYRAGERSGLPINYTATGTWERCLTNKQIEYLETTGTGEFEIADGRWWIPDKVNKPFESIVKWLYEEKERASGIKREVIKRIMAGIWGKFLETMMVNGNPKLGNLFNSIYGSEVEVNCQLEVAKFVIENKINPIHITVDGVVATEPVMLGENGLGKWKLSNVTPCICAGTGAIALRDEGKGDFHLKYDWLKEQIEKEPEASVYKLSKMEPVTIGQAVANGECGRLGELQEIHKYIDIGLVEKRCYKEKPKNGRELLARTYSSSPWDVSIVKSQL